MELISWLVAVYAVICVAAYFGKRLFMYFPDPTRAAPAEAGLDSVQFRPARLARPRHSPNDRPFF